MFACPRNDANTEVSVYRIGNQECTVLLRKTGQQHAVLDPEVERALAFWRRRPVIEAAEIDLLNTLVDQPARAETAARLLGRDVAETQDLLRALVAVGALELQDGYYHATAATALLFQIVRDRGTALD